MSTTADDVVGGGDTPAANHQHVYVRSDEYAWIPARLVAQDQDIAQVLVPQYESEEFIMSDGGKNAIGFESRTVNLKDYVSAGALLPLQNCGSDGILKDVDDMIDLPYRHEAAILYNLKKRHSDGKPYSRLGEILIAVNPYQWLGDLYTDKVGMHYAQKIVWDQNDPDPRNGLPTHLYEVSSLSYKGLAVERRNQSILVNGISGAGKTETVKICIDHIATIQQDPNDRSTGNSMTVKRILDSNRLLEAFGNAKTRHNDNSSRFGKYTMLQFRHVDRKKPGDRPRSALVGSTCEVYFLEKSRVVFHDDTERNFHAFYQLLAAPDDMKAEIWKGLKGTKNDSFAYVGSSPHLLIDGKEDSAHFMDTIFALELIGISGEKYLTLWRAIAACLQLGNLTFAPKPGDEERTVITSTKEFKDLAELIGCDVDVLEKAFTQRTMMRRCGGELFTVPLRHFTAKEYADAFAKEIYAKTFLWLVRSINDATCAENNYPGGASTNFGFIGLLDMCGFGCETLPKNGYQQSCINSCYEKLQEKFNHDIIRKAKEEYRAEGLDLDDIMHADQSDVLLWIEGRIGMIEQLNDECAYLKGDDQFIVSLGRKDIKPVPSVIKECTFDKLKFDIHHYARPLIHKVQWYAVRHSDMLSRDMIEAAKRCKNEIISQHLEDNRCSNMDIMDEEPRDWRDRAKLAKYNVAQFKIQWTTFMKGLSETQSRYICCIKPNTQQRKLVMEHISTMNQLRGAGHVTAALMCRATYSYKLFHTEVVERYRMLNEGNSRIVYPDVKSECEDICKKMLKHFETNNSKGGTTQSGFAIGKTRAYFGSAFLRYLESERSKLLEDVDDVSIDSWVYCSSTDYV